VARRDVPIPGYWKHLFPANRVRFLVDPSWPYSYGVGGSGQEAMSVRLNLIHAKILWHVTLLATRFSMWPGGREERSLFPQ
jgi:hypothetical protein